MKLKADFASSSPVADYDGVLCVVDELIVDSLVGTAPRHGIDLRVVDVRSHR